MQNKELCPYFSFKVVLKPVYILWIKVKKKHLCCKNPPPLYLPEPNPTQRGFTSAAALATVSFLPGPLAPTALNQMSCRAGDGAKPAHSVSMDRAAQERTRTGAPMESSFPWGALAEEEEPGVPAGGPEKRRIGGCSVQNHHTAQVSIIK